MNRFRLFSLGLAGLLAAAPVGTLHAAASWWPFGSSAPAGTAPAPAPGDAPAPFSFSPIVKKVAPSVVTVFTTKKIREQAAQANPLLNDPFFQRFFGNGNGGQGALPGQPPSSAKPRFHEQKGLGSGVIVSSDGVIVTNFHVIDVADEIKVAIGDEKKEYDAKVIGKDQLTDVAVIKIDAKNLPAMPLADSSRVEVGDVVLALGNPFALGQTVTMGIVSALSRNLPIQEAGDTLNSFIQTDAAINPGNSGGPLVDTQGRMVGLNSAIYSRTGGYQGIGFAIPANMVRSVMEGLLKQGHVIRGYLGVEANPDELTPEMLQKFSIPSETPGVLVSSVQPGSAAADAGIRFGDFLVEFNGQKVDDFRALRTIVTQVPPGQKVKISFFRDGKKKTVDVVLKELKEKDLAVSGSPSGPSDGNPSGALTLLPGVAVDDLDADARRQMGSAAPPADIKGAVVVSVDPDSPAAGSGGVASGLAPGDVILEVEHREVHGAKEAVAAAKGSKNGLLLRIWSRGAYRYLVIKAND